MNGRCQAFYCGAAVSALFKQARPGPAARGAGAAASGLGAAAGRAGERDGD